MGVKVVNCRKQTYDVYIGRPSKWGNPFSWLPGTLAEFTAKDRNDSIDKYEAWIKQQPELMASLEDLRGQTLGCFCHPSKCHGDVLAKLVREAFPND